MNLLEYALTQIFFRDLNQTQHYGNTISIQFVNYIVNNINDQGQDLNIAVGLPVYPQFDIPSPFDEIKKVIWRKNKIENQSVGINIKDEKMNLVENISFQVEYHARGVQRLKHVKILFEKFIEKTTNQQHKTNATNCYSNTYMFSYTTQDLIRSRTLFYILNVSMYYIPVTLKVCSSRKSLLNP